jgi:hypothetical protein
MPHYTTTLSRNPHDFYFKTVFSKRENIIPFLKYFLEQDKYLAEQILPLLDFTSLVFINSEVVSAANLSQLIGDVLLRFNLKDSEHYLYMLIELATRQVIIRSIIPSFLSQKSCFPPVKMNVVSFI